MACRIENLSRHTVRLDLRGGEVIVLRPHETTPPLRDERILRNVNIERWLRQRIIRRIDASMQDIRDWEQRDNIDRAVESLTAVDGIGKKRAKELVARGVKNLDELCAMRPRQLAELKGISTESGKEILHNAKELRKKQLKARGASAPVAREE